MVTFVILNYNNAQDTFVCVDSIQQACIGQEYSIVVVDNGSKEECVKCLKDKFSTDNLVKLVCTGENLGFACGNNVGCKAAIEQFNPDFLYVINNDTKIYDSRTIEKIYSIFQETDFDILGPRIYDSVLDTELNPSTSQSNVEEVKAHVKRLKLAKKALVFGALAYKIVYVGYGKLCKKCKYTSFGLCGAALIFSKKYFERFQDVFVPRTFLYGEESYLKYREQKYNLKMLYDDRIYIEHLGSQTTNKMFKQQKNKIRFKVDAKIQSNVGLIEAYEKDLDV